MTREPKIPMSPSELPQQRVHEVVDLTQRPEPFDCKAGYWDYPSGSAPENQPRNPTYLCQVEWAWSPVHNRLDAYYLHRGRSHWSLWSRYSDDNWGKWEWAAAACVHRRGVTEKQAAVYLLLELWKHEVREFDLDQFHWINEGVYITVAELMAIAREVWE